MDELTTDPQRIGLHEEATDIYVRAKGPVGFDTFNLAELDRDSVLIWLRSRGGANEFAENCVLVLLGHDEPGEDHKGE